jgi:hypothetical protein
LGSSTYWIEKTAGRLTHLSHVPTPTAVAAMTKPVIM